MLIRFARPGDQPRLNLHRWAKALEKGDAAKAEQFERRLRDEVFRSLEKYPDIAETLVTLSELTDDDIERIDAVMRELPTTDKGSGHR